MSEAKVLVRAKADAVDDAAPNATLPPETEVWHPGYAVPHVAGAAWPVRGGNFVLEFTTPLGNSCDVVIWKRDEARLAEGLPAWSSAGTLVGVASAVEFLTDDTGAADLYFQLVNVTGGNPIAIRATPRA